MNRALYAAASGMAAQQQNLETIAANLSNAGVTGFKGAASTFEEIASPSGGVLGTALTGTRTLFTQGKLVRSGGAFDVAIDGNGFFVLEHGSKRAYTRAGEFSRAPDGSVQNAQGWRLSGVHIPDDARDLSVGDDGAVTATVHGRKTPCGRVHVAAFASPESLDSSGGTLFFATRASGAGRDSACGREGEPAVKFGMLEQSNVTIVDAMMEILAAQRAYEANAKGVQAADEMMRIADNLQRG